MKNIISRRLSIALLAGTQILGADALLHAQELEEITVTAQRRASSLQDVAVAVTVITESEIEMIDFSDSKSIAAQVPNLQIASPWGAANPGIFMRGIGNGDVNAVAGAKIGVYQDQIYTGLLVGQNFQLFDLERIEALKGPQGTLYGKNTTGGAINIISRQPTVGMNDGYITLSAGNYDAMSIEAGKSFTLSEELSARVSGVLNRRDGTSVNLVNGRDQNNIDNYALRGMLHYESDNFDALLRIQRGRNRSDFRQGKPDTAQGPNGTSMTGFTNPSHDVYEITTDVDNFLNIDQDGIGLVMERHFDTTTLTSVTSYDEASLRALQDADHSADSLIEIGWRTNSKLFTQELRLTSNDAGRFNYIAGLFFAHERIGEGTGSDFRIFADLPPNAPANAMDIKQDLEQTANQYAAFADVNYRLSDKLTLNGGLRYTIDNKKFSTAAQLVAAGDIPVQGVFTVPLTSFDKQWEELTGHVGLEYLPSDNVMIYGGFSRGFNGGGFNGGAIVDPGEATSFAPEYLNAWEVGAKTSLFERRATLNVAAFYYDYQDLQIQTITTSPFSNNFIQVIENASNAVIYGAEIEFAVLVTEHLRVSGGLGLLHSEYKDFKSLVGDATGNKLQQAPNVDLNSVIHYQRPLPGDKGSWFLRGEINFTTEQFHNSAEDPAVSSEGSYEIINLKLGWLSPSEQTRVTFWVNNITDNTYVDRAIDLVGGFGFVSKWYSDPRTYGIQLTYHFN